MQQATSVSDLTRSNRTLVMGIVNVTEDSFSDGGRWLDFDAAINHARELVAQGARHSGLEQARHPHLRGYDARLGGTCGGSGRRGHD